VHRKAFLCLLAAALTLSSVKSNSALASGDEKPASLTLKDLQGSKAKLSQWRGKIVVLNFWATWCGPCNVEMPLIVKAAQGYAGKDVVFVGVSVDDEQSQKKIPEFLKSHQIGYTILTGATDDDMQKLRLGNSVPSTAFIDTDGVIRARILGQIRPGELEERIDWLLNKGKGTAPNPLVTHLDPE
jgi:thiol-disulfide isomerase/thioredoxin